MKGSSIISIAFFLMAPVITAAPIGTPEPLQKSGIESLSTLNSGESEKGFYEKRGRVTVD